MSGARNEGFKPWTRVVFFFFFFFFRVRRPFIGIRLVNPLGSPYRDPYMGLCNLRFRRPLQWDGIFSLYTIYICYKIARTCNALQMDDWLL